MEREISKELVHWAKSSNRKPLILRGARQVGKTWLVRDLARRQGLVLLEVNLERDPGLARLFEATDPQRVFSDLALVKDHRAEAASTLLFIDEIQAAPEVLSKLRWFAEEMPQLAVIAAGSLLEFALADFSYSMPVGRVAYAFVEPMSFPEFLQAHGQEHLLQHLCDWRPPSVLSAAVHEKASEWFDRFQMVGGMPEVVARDVEGASASECRGLQRDLLRTYQDDFAKYSKRLNVRILHAVMLAATASLGKKFVYGSVGEGVKILQARQALELLAMARVCTLIPHTAANGLPLAAERNDRLRKAVLLDIGLAHALWNTPAGKYFPSWEQVAPTIRGMVSEQVAAQQLRQLDSGFSREGELFHWRREGGRAGEIDYLVEIDGKILPVEVKSGSVGAMKSLHQFMHDKKLTLALRMDRNPPSLQAMDVGTTQGQKVKYTLLNLPHYMGCCLVELIELLGLDT